MRIRSLLLLLTAGVAAILLGAGSHFLRGQTPNSVALTGLISSTEEGPMEGVLISATKGGSTVTVTVVSDRQGRYSFPRTKLAAGRYSLRIRAVGYEADALGPVEITAQKAAQLDLRLRKTRDLASQLTSAEWILSMPGTAEQKRIFQGCINCHGVEQAVRSRHNAAEWVGVLQRMARYAPPSTLSHPVPLPYKDPAAANTERFKRQGEYLSTINLSAVSKWEYPLQTFPRPSGKATRVIITEYDLPRKNAQPHDAVVDSEGMVWYADFALPYLGKLDPRTAQVVEYSVPEIKPGFPPGSLEIDLDEDGNVWVARLMQGGISRFDKKTEKFTNWSAPKKYNNDAVRTAMVAARNHHADGKVWFDNAATNRVVHRLDLKSGQIETFDLYPNLPQDSHSIYDIEADSRNNAYFTDMAGGGIGRIDARTGEIQLFPTPTPRSGARRGHMDSQDRFWFGENYVNNIGMFDFQTKQFREWTVPTAWSFPYDTVPDKNGEAWTGGTTADRIVRFNPKSGQFTEYLLPRSTNVRRVNVNNSTTPVTFWVGNNHGASIIKLEPLD